MSTQQVKAERVGGPVQSRWWTALCAVLVMGITLGTATPSWARGAPDSFADLAEKLLPTVVNISASHTVDSESVHSQQIPGLPQFPPGSPFEDLFKDYFDKFRGPQGPDGQDDGQDQRPERKARSLGSGFVIDPKGLIVTNNHVIDGATEIVVSFHDGSELPAELIGRDPKTDIALLKVKPNKPLPSTKFGDSEKARVGDWVLAIGNPFGLGGTVTAGIISAGNRDINAGPYDNFLQTDAPINRGNSGGPMFNMDGDVIGVNSMIFSPSGGSVGIGFAIPSETVKLVIKDIEKYGRVRRGWLGVVIQTVSAEIAESLGMDEAKGALVQSVADGSPADKAGIKAGDVIVTFDDKSVSEMRRLPKIVAETDIGKSVPVKVFRNGELVTLKVNVGELKENPAKVAKDKPHKQVKPTSGSEIEELGLVVAKINQAQRDKYELEPEEKGVVITSVNKDGSAAKKGLQPGMVITAVTQRPVTTPKDVQNAVDAAKKAGRPSVLLQVSRGGSERFVALKLED